MSVTREERLSWHDLNFLKSNWEEGNLKLCSNYQSSLSKTSFSKSFKQHEVREMGLNLLVERFKG